MRLIKAALAVVFAAFLLNCGGGSDPEINRTFFNSSELNTQTKAIESGDNIVFKWEFVHATDGDNALTEELYFEIPGGRTNFNFSFDNGANIPRVYDRICDCPTDSYTITNGFIDGGMVNEGEWRIAFSLSVQNNAGLFLPLQDEGSYSLGN